MIHDDASTFIAPGDSVASSGIGATTGAFALSPISLASLPSIRSSIQVHFSMHLEQHKSKQRCLKEKERYTKNTLQRIPNRVYEEPSSRTNCASENNSDEMLAAPVKIDCRLMSFKYMSSCRFRRCFFSSLIEARRSDLDICEYCDTSLILVLPLRTRPRCLGGCAGICIDMSILRSESGTGELGSVSTSGVDSAMDSDESGMRFLAGDGVDAGSCE